MLIIQIILGLIVPRMMLAYVASLYAYGELTGPMALLALFALWIDLS